MAGTNRRYIRSKALEWVLGESENGKAHVAVSFKVKDPADDVEKYVGWRGWFSEAATERTVESLRYLGFEGDDVSNLVGLDKNEVELVVEDEEYTNPDTGETKTTTRVQFINQVRGPSVKTKLEGEKAKSFAAQMKGAFRAHDAAAGKRVGSTKPQAAAKPAGPLGDEPPPITNEDIPF